MSIIWIAVAFVFGFIARRAGLPPLVGYLAAGFVLHAHGFKADANLEVLADLGITLMLFTIGLKINFRQLLKVEIWGSAISHMSVWMIFMFPMLALMGIVLTSSLLELNWVETALIAFAFSFSSTVCVIKILEDNAELKTRHSDLAIGVLIIQDIVAVLFLFMATGKTPSIWAPAVLLLLPLRPLLRKIFEISGHGELVPLFGFLLAFGGSALFEWVSLKGDLGALLMGMLIAGLPKTNELYKSLLSFKDIFLIGFFLSIGFTALPTAEMWGIALALTLALPLKILLFFLVFVGFAKRARTAFLSALLLGNFSEFGLIVASLSVDHGWLSEDWLVIIALSTTISFVFTSLVYQFAHAIYARQKSIIGRWQREKAMIANPFESPKNARILIVGMGRVGMGAFRTLAQDLGDQVCGVEVDPARVVHFKESGMNVIQGDGDDAEFWEHLPIQDIELVMLAIPSVHEMKNILYQLRHVGYTGRIAAVARYEDERKELLELGADVAFNYYSEVGMGFADESRHLLSS